MKSIQFDRDQNESGLPEVSNSSPSALANAAARLAIYDRKEVTTTLKETKLFSSLPNGDLERIANWLRIYSLKEGDYLFRQSEAAKFCFIVHEGTLEVRRLSGEGDEDVLKVFGPNEVFAEAALVGMEHYPASAMALQNTIVLGLPRWQMLIEMRRKPELGLQMISSLSRHLRHMAEKVENLTSKTA